MNHDLWQKFWLFEFLISQKDRKLQNKVQDWPYLSLGPEVVPICPKISQLLSFQRKFIHLRNRPIIRLHLALFAKNIPKKTIIYVIFSAKIKKLYNTFRSSFSFALVPDLLLLPKNFLHSKIF